MKLIQDLTQFPTDLRGSVVVLGNFDGVHRGHQTVIETGAKQARGAGVPLLVLSFEPHPRQYFKPDAPPFRLTDLRNKAHHLEELGIDGLVVLPFNAALASMSAETFIEDILITSLAPVCVVVGYDFCFGKGRTGTPEMLRDFGQQQGGFDLLTVAPVAPEAPEAPGDGDQEPEAYSSTLIRDCLRKGDPARAAGLLGRPFEIEARVQKGQQLGRTINFPTVNLELGSFLRPAIGIYAVRVGIVTEHDAQLSQEINIGETVWHDGAGYYGARPTVSGDGELFEAFIFDFEGDLYGRIVRVALIDFIRGDEKFETLEEMQDQIAKDCDKARAILTANAQ